MNAISTVKRIQDAIENALLLHKDGMTISKVKRAVMTDETRADRSESWDRQFQMALLGLIVRNRIYREHQHIRRATS